MNQVAILPLLMTSPDVESGESWWQSVVAPIRLALLPRRERALFREAKRLATQVGAPILLAQSCAELEHRLGEAIENQALTKFNAVVAKHGLPVGWDRVSEMRPTPALQRTLGRAPSEVLASTGPLFAAALSAYAQIISMCGREALVAMAEDLDPHLLFVQHGVHTRIKYALLGGMFAAVSQLAIGHAVVKRRRLDAWLALALAERVRDGMRAYVTLLAALPNVVVPESVVPAGERADLRQLQQEADAAEQRLLSIADSVGPCGPAVTDGDD